MNDLYDNNAKTSKLRNTTEVKTGLKQGGSRITGLGRNIHKGLTISKMAQNKNVDKICYLIELSYLIMLAVL